MTVLKEVSVSSSVANRNRAAGILVAALSLVPGFPPALHGQGPGKMVGAVTDPQGFKTFTQSGVTLPADEAVTVDVRLQLGAATEKVVVTAEAPQVDTVTGTLGQVVDTRRVVDLPLDGRNAASLTALVAGVVAAPNDSADQRQTKTYPVGVTISANGSRANVTNYMLDGGNNVDEYTNVNLPFPFPDALQEFSVETCNYSALEPGKVHRAAHRRRYYNPNMAT